MGPDAPRFGIGNALPVQCAHAIATPMPVGCHAGVTQQCRKGMFFASIVTTHLFESPVIPSTPSPTRPRGRSRRTRIVASGLAISNACLRVLKHHGFVALIDMFFFTNRYETVSSTTHALLRPDNKLLTEAVAFCLRGQTHPSPGSQENSPSFQGVGSPTNDSGSRSSMLNNTSFRMTLATSVATTGSENMILQRVQRREDYLNVRTALAELYNACSRAESIGDLWLSILAGEKLPHVTSLNWRKMFSLIDHRRFATFGVVHGLLRRVHNFPMYRGSPTTSHPLPDIGLSLGGGLHEHQPPPHVPPPPSFFGSDRFVRYTSTESTTRTSLPLSASQVAARMDGNHCDDALVCEFGKPLEELMDLVGKDKVISLYATPPRREETASSSSLSRRK
eukprot:scaffold34936_cov176-Amphora_coffeaeformis.AAC.1